MPVAGGKGYSCPQLEAEGKLAEAARICHSAFQAGL